MTPQVRGVLVQPQSAQDVVRMDVSADVKLLFAEAELLEACLYACCNPQVSHVIGTEEVSC